MSLSEAGKVGRPYDGLHALIVGSSYGIGAATAERLAAGGANIVLSGRTATVADRSAYQPISLEETEARLKRYGTKVVAIRADMGDEVERMQLVPTAVASLGAPIDILVNNAAAGIYKPTSTYSLKHRRLMMEVNFHAPVDLIQQVVPGMQDRGAGWIVNVSSGVARYRHGSPESVPQPAAKGNPFGSNQGVYGATKAALNRVTVALAHELLGTGIRVNTVEPTGAVFSDGAVARGMDMIPESAVQSMEAMVESIVYLCECPEERTGGVHSSIALLEELNRQVITLDGSAAFAGGFRRVLA